MNLPMTDQPRLLGKAFATNIAHVRTLTSVRENMLSLGTRTCKRPVANWTRIGLDARVRSHVNGERTFLGEGFAAFFAYDLLLVPKHMLIKILLRDHPLRTDRTLVLGLEMGKLLVHLERVIIDASSSAYVTDHRRISAVVLNHVTPQVVFHLVSLVANFA